MKYKRLAGEFLDMGIAMVSVFNATQAFEIYTSPGYTIDDMKLAINKLSQLHRTFQNDRQGPPPGLSDEGASTSAATAEPAEAASNDGQRREYQWMADDELLQMMEAPIPVIGPDGLQNRNGHGGIGWEFMAVSRNFSNVSNCYQCIFFGSAKLGKMWVLNGSPEQWVKGICQKAGNGSGNSSETLRRCLCEVKSGELTEGLGIA